MLNPLLLSPMACLGKYWRPPDDIGFLSSMSLLPIHARELAGAAASMPLAAVKRGNHWHLMAVCGLEADENLFIREGEWLGAHRPDCLETLPFDSLTLVNKTVLGFERRSGLEACSEQGTPFFVGQQLHPSVKPYIECLQKRSDHYRATQRALALLDGVGLLVPWPDHVVYQGNISGEVLFMADEQALAHLSNDLFLSIRAALPVAYALNFSFQQLRLLNRLRQARSSVPRFVSLDDDKWELDFD